jgi:hypothetical protein
VKVVQTSWNRLTIPYEDAVARDFAALGFTVTWVPYWRDDLRARTDEARKVAEKNGQPVDEAAFIEKNRHEKRR